MFNLFVSYFQSTNQARQLELDNCLNKNLENKLIQNIYLLVEEPIDIKLNKKIHQILIKSRPSYNNIFEIIKQNSREDEWNIISNSDIYFDNTLALINKYRSNKKLCLALCRWEVTTKGITFLNRKDSQDCWIFKGHPKNVQGNFNLGTAGCDNAIADRFWRAGYDVINPSKTIKTYHLHESQLRTYNPDIKVPQPYKLLMPTI